MTPRFLTRRAVLTDMGKAGMAIMVFGAAACSSETSPTTSSTSPQSPGTTGDSAPSSTAAAAPETTAPNDTGSPDADAADFRRVELGNVSAYLLYRDGEAALVDTGNPGSISTISAALTEIGLGWDAVGHVILTHQHNDHIGSLGEVVAEAPDAQVYAHLNDIPAMLDRADPMPVTNDDDIFGLRVVETPGHTPGHISILDPAGNGTLVVGDAIFNFSGLEVSLPQFTSNTTQANASVKILAQLQYETALFGHGDPILTGASTEVQKLAAGVP